MLNIDLDKFRQVFGAACENPGNPEAEAKDALYMSSLLYEFPQEDLVGVIGFICAGFSGYFPVAVSESEEASKFFTFLYTEALDFEDEDKAENLINLMTQQQKSCLLSWLREASQCKDFQFYTEEIRCCLEVIEKHI